MWQEITISGNKFLIEKTKYVKSQILQESVSALSQFFNVIFLLKFVV